MDLYDDLDTKQRAGQIDGWSSGIKMLQTQLAIKKATLPTIKKELPKKPTSLMTPVIINKKATEEDLNSAQRSTIEKSKHATIPTAIITTKITPAIQPPSTKVSDYDWDVVDEYDPMWPNEYEKLVKEKRDRDRKDDRKRKASKKAIPVADDAPPSKYSGFISRGNEEDRSPPASSNSSGSNRGVGVAIAPPPSLQESSSLNANNDSAITATIPYGAGSVAARIMAKYGFKDGQGLGKQEQGMSMALQVEKTSKRGGRIIHEKELFAPPPPPPPPPTPTSAPIQPVAQPIQPASPPNSVDSSSKPEQSITEIMKCPSKVVLLRNMVGPGEVDSELEPEVKDECNTKYGDVISVTICELNNSPTPEEAVRIFVEFKRIESAIKAVVDLNGRFFGGRQVRAGFYNFDKFKNSQLNG